jgi:adenosylmethionine-8-amino-7-oxononanoate aminotransferase
VELVRDRRTRERFSEADDLPRRMTEKLRRRGLICRVMGDVIPLAPPLVISKVEIDEVVGILKASIDEFARETGARP